MDPDNDITKEKDKGPFLLTAEEYASNCTIHGIAYCFALGKWKVDRALWFLIVLGAIAFGAYSNLEVLKETDPILTAVETAGLPIEDVPFPSITICSQGSVNEIIDAAFFKQFNEYLEGKRYLSSRKKRHEEKQYLSVSEMEQEGMNFLAEKYPGAKYLPLEMVQILGSPGLNPDTFLENEAILNSEDDQTGCQIQGLPVARIKMSTKTNHKICIQTSGNVNWKISKCKKEDEIIIIETVPGLPNGSFVLKSNHGKYFTIGVSNVVESNGVEIEDADIFILDPVNGTGYSIKSEQNGNYLSSNNSDGTLTVSQSVVGLSEIFHLSDKTKGNCYRR